jgi:hypothetical protein
MPQSKVGMFAKHPWAELTRVTHTMQRETARQKQCEREDGYAYDYARWLYNPDCEEAMHMLLDHALRRRKRVGRTNQVQMQPETVRKQLLALLGTVRELDNLAPEKEPKRA